MDKQKYAIELIPVKKYKKGLVSLVEKTVKDITNHTLKLSKVFSQQSMPFKANASLCSNAS